MTDPAAHPVPFGWFHAARADRGWHRTWTVVANDGIIATAAILEGFSGAGASDQTLVRAATAATIAGMMAAGGAEWAEAAAEREAQLTVVEDEAAEITRQPDVEHAELAVHYEEKGLPPQLASEVADQLMAHNAIDAQLESEHGILKVVSRAETVRVGIGSAIAYLLGAAIPLIVTLAVPVAVESTVILAAVVVSLFVTSAIGARTGHTTLSHTLVRSLAVGLAAMAVSYLVGRLVF